MRCEIVKRRELHRIRMLEWMNGLNWKQSFPWVHTGDTLFVTAKLAQQMVDDRETPPDWRMPIREALDAHRFRKRANAMFPRKDQ